MVLMLPDSTPCTAAGTSLTAFFEHSTEIQDITSKFLGNSGDSKTDSGKHVYVGQGECAHVDLRNEPEPGLRLLSHMATTCIIIILHCEESHRAFVAHMDGATDIDLAEITEALAEMKSPEVLLVGAYDGRDDSTDVLAPLLRHLHHLPTPCRMRLFCCGRLNTSSKGEPLAQGLCYSTTSKACHCPPPDTPAVPQGLRRQALWWAAAMCSRPKCGFCKVYDSSSAALVLPGMDLRWPWEAEAYVAMMLHQPDEKILQMCSTSPNAELPGFAEGVRAKMEWCLVNIKDGMLQVASETLYFSHAQGWLPSSSNS